MAAGGTFSATLLAWSHAQYVRLAWSIDAGHPVEQPSIVAERYAGAATSP
jgi:glucoamylase